MWTCPICGRNFEKPNQNHPCQAIATTDDYIAAQPEALREKLHAVRDAIRAVLPDATESIKWRMPTFYQKENLIHFACQRHHLGIYPGEEAVSFFKERLTQEGYASSKGAVRFPWDREIPLSLIQEIARHRLQAVTKE